MNKWDKRGLLEAKLAASYSKDPNTKVGAYLMKPNKRPASKGFNGFAPGINDYFIHDRNFKLNAIIHAEENALDLCESCEGYSLYVWGLCICGRCTAKAISKGVKKIICVQEKERPDWEESFKVSRAQADMAKISLLVYKLEEIDPRLFIKFPVFE